MHHRTASWFSRGSLVFGVVAVLALGSTVATRGLAGASREHFASARATMNAECRALGGTAGTPCDRQRVAGSMVPAWRRAGEEVKAADQALARGDRRTAALGLARALEDAESIDRRRHFIASDAAGELIHAVASRVDAEPSLLDSQELVTAVRRVSFSSAQHPFATERLMALSRIAATPDEVPVPTAGLAEARAAQAMSDLDATLRRMDQASVARDVGACRAAAASAAGYARYFTVGPDLCTNAQRIVANGERLAGLREKANARATTVRL